MTELELIIEAFLENPLYSLPGRDPPEDVDLTQLLVDFLGWLNKHGVKIDEYKKD